MSSLYIFINIVYRLPKKLKCMKELGFQRAQVLWSCPRKEVLKGGKLRASNSELVSSLERNGLRLALEKYKL